MKEVKKGKINQRKSYSRDNEQMCKQFSYGYRLNFSLQAPPHVNMRTAFNDIDYLKFSNKFFEMSKGSLRSFNDTNFENQTLYFTIGKNYSKGF